MTRVSLRSRDSVMARKRLALIGLIMVGGLGAIILLTRSSSSSDLEVSLLATTTTTTTTDSSTPATTAIVQEDEEENNNEKNKQQKETTNDDSSAAVAVQQKEEGSKSDRSLKDQREHQQKKQQQQEEEEENKEEVASADKDQTIPEPPTEPAAQIISSSGGGGGQESSQRSSQPQEAEEEGDNNNQQHQHQHQNTHNTPDKNKKVVHYVNQKDVTQQDSFSATWLQSKKDFLEMDLTPIGICEDAAFKAWKYRRHKLRMTLDYLDFSVEHLSKWWKLLDYHEQPIIYQAIMDKLHKYITLEAVAAAKPQQQQHTQQKQQQQEEEESQQQQLLLQETVVTIAFQPYSPPRAKYYIKKNNPLPAERSYNLTVISLAATIESLRRAQMGRIVVVGSDDSHQQFAQDAFNYLHQHLPHLPYVDGSGQQQQQQQIGHLELGFVKITESFYRTNSVLRNMPKGCLVGAQKAFQLADRQQALKPEEELFLQQWFGTKQPPTYWKYLYLTEPDTLLVTRNEALVQIKEEIDGPDGGIFSPWRLQPIMHESDMIGYPIKDRFLHISDGFEEVIELDHTTATTATTHNIGNQLHDNTNKTDYDVCCDERPGKGSRPGVNQFPPCSGKKKWFMCGFQSTPENLRLGADHDRHERLRPYKLIRLVRGSGLTLVAGNLFGRRCFPATKSQCLPYHSGYSKSISDGNNNATSSSKGGQQQEQEGKAGGKKRKRRRRKKKKKDEAETA